MKILLDTQALLCVLSGKGLGQKATEAFLDPTNALYLSAACFWEMCIKISVGKLVLAEGWGGYGDSDI